MMGFWPGCLNTRIEAAIEPFRAFCAARRGPKKALVAVEDAILTAHLVVGVPASGLSVAAGGHRGPPFSVAAHWWQSSITCTFTT